MENIVCMIPVRKGSNRVPGKALRKIGDITLLEQSILLALTYFEPENIYLNTDWEDLNKIAKTHKINFYKRYYYHSQVQFFLLIKTNFLLINMALIYR